MKPLLFFEVVSSLSCEEIIWKLENVWEQIQERGCAYQFRNGSMTSQTLSIQKFNNSIFEQSLFKKTLYLWEMTLTVETSGRRKFPVLSLTSEILWQPSNHITFIASFMSHVPLLKRSLNFFFFYLFMTWGGGPMLSEGGKKGRRFTISAWIPLMS